MLCLTLSSRLRGSWRRGQWWRQQGAELEQNYLDGCTVLNRWWQPTPVLLPVESHGQRSLIGCSPWCRKESCPTEWLHFHFSLSCIGEGNGNPLQCSCLENPRDWGAWWAAVYGVTQSRTRLMRLSSVLNGITYSMDMSLNKLWEIVKDREAWPSVLQSMGSQSQTRLSDWTTANVLVTFCFLVDSGVFIYNLHRCYIILYFVSNIFWKENFKNNDRKKKDSYKKGY